ncbi:MAG: heme exporter protein CcmD [Pseudomonadota bacterium]
MMPDLGKYADAVLGAYAVSLLLLAGVVIMSVLRSRRVKAELDALEERRASDG